MPHKHKTILWVDDSPGECELIGQALAQHGLADSAQMEDSVESAMTFLCAQLQAMPPILPRLILVDMKLKGESGLELVRRVRSDRRLACLPVVMLTTSDDPKDIRASYSVGANGYVLKPGTYQDFLTLIKVLCRYWLHWNKNVMCF